MGRPSDSFEAPLAANHSPSSLCAPEHLRRWCVLAASFGEGGKREPLRHSVSVTPNSIPTPTCPALFAASIMKPQSSYFLVFQVLDHAGRHFDTPCVLQRGGERTCTTTTSLAKQFAKLVEDCTYCKSTQDLPLRPRIMVPFRKVDRDSHRLEVQKEGFRRQPRRAGARGTFPLA